MGEWKELADESRSRWEAVIGVADEEYGRRLKAFVVPEKGDITTPEELMEWLRPHLARYQMPREIAIVGEPPYTPQGKPDRKRLL